MFCKIHRRLRPVLSCLFLGLGDGVSRGYAFVKSAYVENCRSSYSPQLLKPLGIKAPVYPLKGYSLTVPITNPAMAPTSTILDETYKVAITRFDNRIRVGGMAEIAGFDLSLNPRRRETLEKIVNDLYPQGGNLAEASFWTGLRSTTPDGTPIVGATPFKNLSLIHI